MSTRIARPGKVRKENRLLPFLKWAGGKRWLVNEYQHLLPDTFERYVEPFVGSGAVFFHLAPPRALLSDTNPELIETYLALRDNWRRVERYLERHQLLHSRAY